MDVKRIIVAAMDGVCQGGRDAVLYLDETMTVDAGCHLPVIVVEGLPGYVTFLMQYRSMIARYFGTDFGSAIDVVNEINAACEYSAEAADRVVEDSMALAAKEDHERAFTANPRA